MLNTEGKRDTYYLQWKLIRPSSESSLFHLNSKMAIIVREVFQRWMTLTDLLASTQDLILARIYLVVVYFRSNNSKEISESTFGWYPQAYTENC
jgi:hypothetical protein